VSAPPSYATYRDALGGRPLPAAFVDLDRLRANAVGLAARSAPRPLRLATKSVRCVALLRLVLAERREFRGLMCFTADEAAWLASEGFDDLLVGYPTAGEAAIEAAAAAVASGRTIVFTVDDERQLEPLQAVASRRGVRFGLCIDADMSTSFPGLHFGVRRSPLRGTAGVVALARAIQRHDRLRLDGLLGYEAQIAGVPDSVPGRRVRSAFVRALKRRSMVDIRRRRLGIVTALREAGFELRFVNGGGTGSLEATAADPSVTETTAGSGLFAPGLFDGYAAFHHQPAAGFALAVTRVPAPGIVTCHGGGYAASGAAGADKLPRPFLPEGAALLPMEGAGEVQTPVAYVGPVTLGIGDPVFFRHAKAGELCERFDRLFLLSNGRIVDEVPTYRGEGKCFL
jgi:D-serine deaminase-like pyridoxal phosphate-dependent protein